MIDQPQLWLIFFAGDVGIAFGPRSSAEHRGLMTAPPGDAC